ncbi:MAG: DUF3109 family protein [Marinilabiliaceae bacterium]|jgi:hypothetical protein|nr:DUF3109 family protein [Marinilabiliaceae bacterium]
MLSIDRTVISMNLFDRKFCCDLEKCRGSCCRYGDSGAPLEEAEAVILEEIWPVVKDYMRAEGIDAVEHKGTSMIDSDGDTVTPLIGNAECAYAVIDDGIYRCAIEKAWTDGKIKFRKPESCHLFPVRIKKYREFDAVNYEEWKICKAALKKGEELDLPVYRFLKEPLIRVYGKSWYSEVEKAAGEIEKSKYFK